MNRNDFEFQCEVCSLKFRRYLDQRKKIPPKYCGRICQAVAYKERCKGKANPNYKHGMHGVIHYCKCGKEKDLRAAECIDCRKIIRPKEEILKAVSESKTVYEASRKLLIGRRWLTEYIRNNTIDVSHFVQARGRRITDDDIFTGKFIVSRAVARARLLKNNLIKYQCLLCGLGPRWNNMELVLELDHINGNHKDNKIENLRFLCPNCHSQAPTSKGKKRK